MNVRNDRVVLRLYGVFLPFFVFKTLTLQRRHVVKGPQSQ